MRGSGPRSATRRQMTEELFAAHQAGHVRAASIRASDFFGPGVTESLVGSRLFGPLLAGKTVSLVADPDTSRSLSYVPDIGRAMVTVGEHDEAFGRAWHVPNAPPLTLRAFVAAAARAAGVPGSISSIPRWLATLLVPALGLATPPLRGLQENFYVYYEPYVVDHSAYVQAFGQEATPIEDALAATVSWYRSSVPGAGAAR